MVNVNLTSNNQTLVLILVDAILKAGVFSIKMSVCVVDALIKEYLKIKDSNGNEVGKIKSSGGFYNISGKYNLPSILASYNSFRVKVELRFHATVFGFPISQALDCPLSTGNW